MAFDYNPVLNIDTARLQADLERFGLDEMGEVAMAIADETPERVQDELLDVLATSVRFFNGEHQ